MNANSRFCADFIPRLSWLDCELGWMPAESLTSKKFKRNTIKTAVFQIKNRIFLQAFAVIIVLRERCQFSIVVSRDVRKKYCEILSKNLVSVYS